MINMRRLHKVRAEIDTDPEALGYAGKTNDQVAALMNAANRQRVKDTLPSKAVFEAIDMTEFAALTDAQRQLVLTTLSISEDVDPRGNAAAIFVQVFGLQSDTITALVALRTETVSRAEELDLGTIEERDVRHAKTL